MRKMNITKCTNVHYGHAVLELEFPYMMMMMEMKMNLLSGSMLLQLLI